MLWTDRLLGKSTMYRVVLIVLLGLAAYSLVVSALGQLFYSPLELAVSLVVATAVSWGSNRLIAALFRVKPHGESALITGLLLFFILQPTVDPAGLGIIALAALVANASKYVIAVRGRHIVNPAAFGALLVGVVSVALGGDAVSWWWAGSAPMLPAVLVGALLVVLRTRRVAAPALFVLVAAGIIGFQLLSGGQNLLAAITTPFVSYPILFFAGFMFTEPLTLPPRRWQQLLEAVVVAALFALPYNIGPIFATPELALVVGNLVAFAFMQHRGLRLRLDSRRRVTPSVTELSFAVPVGVKFDAGQYVELDVPHAKRDKRGARRMFSIVSEPADPRRLTVAYREGEPLSSFKAALAELEEGQSVRATGVWGDFTLPRDRSRPVILIAAGIGVTPFVSQLLQREAEGDTRDIVLVYGVSDTAELAYGDDISRIGVRVLVSAPEPPDRLPPRWEYLGPGRITHERLVEAVPDLAERTAYISGPPGLIAQLKPALKRVTRVHTDAFAGY